MIRAIRAAFAASALLFVIVPASAQQPAVEAELVTMQDPFDPMADTVHFDDLDRQIRAVTDTLCVATAHTMGEMRREVDCRIAFIHVLINVVGTRVAVAIAQLAVMDGDPAAVELAGAASDSYTKLGELIRSTIATYAR